MFRGRPPPQAFYRSPFEAHGSPPPSSSTTTTTMKPCAHPYPSAGHGDERNRDDQPPYYSDYHPREHVDYRRSPLHGGFYRGGPYRPSGGDGSPRQSSPPSPPRHRLPIDHKLVITVGNELTGSASRHHDREPGGVRGKNRARSKSRSCARGSSGSRSRSRGRGRTRSPTSSSSSSSSSSASSSSSSSSSSGSRRRKRRRRSKSSTSTGGSSSSSSSSSGRSGHGRRRKAFAAQEVLRRRKETEGLSCLPVKSILKKAPGHHRHGSREAGFSEGAEELLRAAKGMEPAAAAAVLSALRAHPRASLPADLDAEIREILDLLERRAPPPSPPPPDHVDDEEKFLYGDSEEPVAAPPPGDAGDGRAPDDYGKLQNLLKTVGSDPGASDMDKMAARTMERLEGNRPAKRRPRFSSESSDDARPSPGGSAKATLPGEPPTAPAYPPPGYGQYGSYISYPPTYPTESGVKGEYSEPPVFYLLSGGAKSCRVGGTTPSVSVKDNKESQKLKVLEEREKLKREREQRMKKKEYLIKELERLRKQQGELLRKKRRQKDGHKDPLLQEIALLQEDVMSQISALRREHEAAEGKRAEIQQVALLLGLGPTEPPPRPCADKGGGGGDSPRRQREETTGAAPPPAPPPEPLEYYDAGNHWCQNCNVTSGSVFDFLSHLHSKSHRKSVDPHQRPWARSSGQTPRVEERETKPAKGCEFLLPVRGFFCQLCHSFLGDAVCAEEHVTATSHNHNYEKKMYKDPLYEERRNPDRQAGQASDGPEKKRRRPSDESQKEEREDGDGRGPPSKSLKEERQKSPLPHGDARDRPKKSRKYRQSEEEPEQEDQEERRHDEEEEEEPLKPAGEGRHHGGRRRRSEERERRHKSDKREPEEGAGRDVARADAKPHEPPKILCGPSPAMRAKLLRQSQDASGLPAANLAKFPWSKRESGPAKEATKAAAHFIKEDQEAAVSASPVSASGDDHVDDSLAKSKAFAKEIAHKLAANQSSFALPAAVAGQARAPWRSAAPVPAPSPRAPTPPVLDPVEKDHPQTAASARPDHCAQAASRTGVADPGVSVLGTGPGGPSGATLRPGHTLSAPHPATASPATASPATASPALPRPALPSPGREVAKAAPPASSATTGAPRAPVPSAAAATTTDYGAARSLDPAPGASRPERSAGDTEADTEADVAAPGVPESEQTPSVFVKPPPPFSPSEGGPKSDRPKSNLAAAKAQDLFGIFYNSKNKPGPMSLPRSTAAHGAKLTSPPASQPVKAQTDPGPPPGPGPSDLAPASDPGAAPPAEASPQTDPAQARNRLPSDGSREPEAGRATDASDASLEAEAGGGALLRDWQASVAEVEKPPAEPEFHLQIESVWSIQSDPGHVLEGAPLHSVSVESPGRERPESAPLSPPPTATAAEVKLRESGPRHHGAIWERPPAAEPDPGPRTRGKTVNKRPPPVFRPVRQTRSQTRWPREPNQSQ
ncbi:uncharacterized protein znf318 isoform X2 [Stigmatopora nigra]